MLLYIIFICTYVPGLVYIRGDTGGAIDLVSKVKETNVMSCTDVHAAITTAVQC